MSDAGEMTHDEMTHDYAADEMVAAADSDQGDDDEMTHDEMTHDNAEAEMIYNDDGDGVAATHSSNNIESTCMDSHICNTPHHDQVSYPEARYMNSMLSTPIKQSRSFSYLLLLIIY